MCVYTHNYNSLLGCLYPWPFLLIYGFRLLKLNISGSATADLPGMFLPLDLLLVSWYGHVITGLIHFQMATWVFQAWQLLVSGVFGASCLSVHFLKNSLKRPTVCNIGIVDIIFAFVYIFICPNDTSWCINSLNRICLIFTSQIIFPFVPSALYSCIPLTQSWHFLYVFFICCKD